MSYYSSIGWDSWDSRITIYPPPETDQTRTYTHHCPHGTISPKLIPYLTQLIEYHRQLYPEHLYPAEEGEAICLKCAVYHYKKLKE